MHIKKILVNCPSLKLLSMNLSLFS
uniref:Uncharacterized protein n=1 Tax=Arundo donax TaxID=35708 RepID=A0A0A8YHH6_ARUDO